MTAILPIVQGYMAARISRREHQASLIRRPWSRTERLIVLHGFAGRMCIAIEPIVCGTMFLALTIGMFIVHTDPARPTEHNMAILAPVFVVGVIACAFHALAVMISPVRALLQTFKPIFIVDGYVRYRAADAKSPDGSNGYVAVLNESSFEACEWPTIGIVPLTPMTLPALCEFSEYGGIHRIDGRLTGVLPETIAPFGVGIAPRRATIVPHRDPYLEPPRGLPHDSQEHSP
jgi:hypothetical protein